MKTPSWDELKARQFSQLQLKIDALKQVRLSGKTLQTTPWGMSALMGTATSTV